MTEVQLTALTATQSGCLGGIAGTFEVCLLQPLLFCKNATQQKIPLTLDPRVLYRGIGVSIGNMVTMTAVQFPLTGLVSRAITAGQPRSLENKEKIMAGFLGGALSGTGGKSASTL